MSTDAEHASGGGLAGTVEPQEVDARGQPRATIVGGTPTHRPSAGGTILIHERRHPLPRHVVDGDAHLPPVRRAPANPSLSVEWVGADLSIFEGGLPAIVG